MSSDVDRQAAWRAGAPRRRAFSLESSRLARQARAARGQLLRCRAEMDQLRVRAVEAEAALALATGQVAEAEERSRHFACLYIIGHRLLGLRTRGEVCLAIQDVVANFVGSEEVAVFALDPSGRARVIAAYGVDPAPFAGGASGEGLIARVAQSGQACYRQGGRHLSAAAPPTATPSRGEDDLTACVPIRALDGRALGVIALFGLLPQKASLGPLDAELLEALGKFAASALQAVGPGSDDGRADGGA